MLACGTRRVEVAQPPSDAPAAIDATTAVDAAAPDAPPPEAPPVDAAVAIAPPPGWTDLAIAIPDAVLDLRYATANNLTGAPLYPVARCWLRADPAARLVDAATTLRARGHRLVLWDCYRPSSVQHELWRRVPDPRFVARPKDDASGKPIGGSVHSRGGAVDVSLADPSGQLRSMPTDHDAFSRTARGDDARGATRDYLADLRAAMIGAGFAPIATEWWHFEAKGARAAPLVDLPLQ